MIRFSFVKTPPATPWFWRATLIAAVCLIGGAVGFVVFTLRQDQAEQRSTLISDVLWLEQSLRFHLERNEATLAYLAVQLPISPHPGPALTAHANQALGHESGLEQLLWFDRDLQMLGSLPASSRLDNAAGSAALRNVLKKVRAFAKPVYAGPFVDESGSQQLLIAVPGNDGQRLIGYVVAVFPIDKLLYQEVPWWFSQRYRLSVLNAESQEIASKSRVAATNPDLSYEVAFDPPGGGLSLRLDAYRTSTRAVPLIFTTSMAVLAIALLGCLIGLWQHSLRRQAAEQALRRESCFRRAMEDSLHTGLRARDLSGRITYVNPAFCQIVGWSESELLGQVPPMPYWAPEELDKTRIFHERVIRGELSHQAIELRFQRRNGQRFDALIYEAPLIDENGMHTGWMGSIVDITNRKLEEEFFRVQQERLQATARLVAVGELASTLAHEINQPLAAVSAYAHGCLCGMENDILPRSELMDALNKIAQQSERAGNIIHHIQDYVRRREPKEGHADLITVVNGAATLLEPLARQRGVRMLMILPDAPVIIDGDGTLLEQVVVNLMRNGMDAMETTLPAQRELEVTITTEADLVILGVKDHGTGVSLEVAQKLFAPLFTTKPEGMGMGLNICRSIIEWHRGRMSFENGAEGGTTFYIALPKVRKQ